MKHIKQLKIFERPREKLQALGPTNLTEVELLALLLGSGTRRYPVFQLAEQILRTVGLAQLLTVTASQLAAIPGLGQVQAGKLVAAIELGKRLSASLPQRQIIQAEDVLQEIHSIRDKNREHLMGLYLNARNEVVHKEIITIGGLNFNSLEPRDVFAPALKYPCVSVILAHNHPSGDATPSLDDKKMTHELVKAGQLLGIRVVDHLVVTRSTWSSVLAPPP